MVSNTFVDVNKSFSIPNQSFEQIRRKIPELYKSLTESTSPFFLNHALSFEEKLTQIYVFQHILNPVYKRYCTSLGWSVEDYSRCFDELPPLLPVQAFKDAEVWTHNALIGDRDISTHFPNLKASTQPLEFFSSGTSAMQRSRHRVLDPAYYDASIRASWQARFGKENWIIWAYTPGYSENPQSSLLYMINRLMEWDHTEQSRYLSLNQCLPMNQLHELVAEGHQVMLFGASFGWLDLIELHERETVPLNLPKELTIMETGGMKTFRRSISRLELFDRLVQGFNCLPDQLYTEYGMTECLSQSYTSNGLWLQCPEWVKVVVVDSDEPNKLLEPGQEGRIGIVDLANIYSCSFLLTGDRGVKDEKGDFQILGRWEPTSMRGCNFLIEQDG
tara:strand:- start:6045 stop:7211 length:1167 start_codon:yes stop_codon:yes gene_type:complete